MAGISRYEAAALGLTAAFVFFTAGWFFASRTASDPYTVTVQHSQSTAVSSAEQTQTGESSQPESLLEGERIPVNTADVYELDRLPGIGPTKAQAIVDSAVNDANGIRQSSIQYTDDMLRSLQTIINHTMEGAKGRFDAFMTSMQSSYDIVSSNRNELSGGIVRPEEGEGQASQEMDDGQQKA